MEHTDPVAQNEENLITTPDGNVKVEQATEGAAPMSQQNEPAPAAQSWPREPRFGPGQWGLNPPTIHPQVAGPASPSLGPRHFGRSERLLPS